MTHLQSSNGSVPLAAKELKSTSNTIPMSDTSLSSFSSKLVLTETLVSGSSSSSLSTTSFPLKSPLTASPFSSSHPLWIDSEGLLVKEMKWRDGDIVVSVPAKCGTTWAMNIVHQLRSGIGDSQFRDIYEQIPWLDFWEHPTQSIEELHRRWSSLPTWYPRTFKTHHSPEVLPFQQNVKYIVVIRDPRDAAESFFPFLNAHSNEFLDAWSAPAAFEPKTMEDTWNHPAIKKGQTFIGFFKYWWPYRNYPNVLMLHFSDMSKDHKGTIKKFQNFLNFGDNKNKLIDENFEKICEYTSFEWMKKKMEINFLFSIFFLVPYLVEIV